MENNGMLNLGFNLDSLDAPGGFDKPVNPPDGISYWRILPALSPTLSLFHKYSLHWGFVNASGKKQPVQCSYPYERYCPVDARVREVEDLLKRAEANGDTQKIEEYKAFIGEWRVRNQFLYNALNAAGEAVILSLGKTAHDGLVARITESVRPPMGPDGVNPIRLPFDPTSLNDGVWFKITRSGKGFKTEYAVDFHRGMDEKLDRRPVDAALADKIRKQIQQGGTGPLKNIHDMYEIRTAAELKGMMDGTIPVGGGNKRPATVQSAAPVAPPVHQHHAHHEHAHQHQAPSAPVAPPVFPQQQAAPMPPVTPASTAIPPMAPPPGSPGMAAPSQPTNTIFDGAEARKRLEERLRQSKQS